MSISGNRFVATLCGWMNQSASLPAKLLRFSAVGTLSGVVFLLATIVLTSWLVIDAKISSVIGYVVSMPVNFIGNRRYSFRSRASLVGDLLRFSILHVANMTVTAAAMATVTDWLEMSFIFGAIAAILLVPITTFVAMNFWVFRYQAPEQRSGSSEAINNESPA